MVYYTGDIHGSPLRIRDFCNKMSLTDKDIIVILGNVGVNYYSSKKDARAKWTLNNLGPTIFSIHGNHEQRPANISTYKIKEWNGGLVWYEEQFPNLLFAKDGEIFRIHFAFPFFQIIGGYPVTRIILSGRPDYPSD